MPPNVGETSPLASLVIEKLGGRTTYRERALTFVGVVNQLLENNPNRVAWIVLNESPNTVRLGNTPEISTTTGWLLAPNGGVISMIYDEDGETVSAAVFVSPSVSTDVIRVREILRL